MCRVVRAGRSSSTAGLSRRGEHLLQPLADEATASDWAGEQVGIVGVVDLAVVELLQFLTPSAPRNVCRLFLLGLFGRASIGSHQLGGTDNAEFRRWIVDRLFPRRQAQRLSGRVACGARCRGRRPRPTPSAVRRHWRPLRDAPRPPNSAWPNGNGGLADARRRASRLPAAIIEACTATDSRVVRAGNDGSMNTVWPSVHGGSPGRCASTATARPAKAEASMPRVCNRSASAPSATGHLRVLSSMLTKYLFQPRAPARPASTTGIPTPRRIEQIFGMQARTRPDAANVPTCRHCSSSSG